jgi:hypothetical protein
VFPWADPKVFSVFPGIPNYFDTPLCIYVYIVIYVIMLYFAVFSLIAAQNNKKNSFSAWLRHIL